MSYGSLNFFDDESKQFIQLPFVEKYEAENPQEVGETYEVISVAPAKSGSGYKLETSKFVVFLRTGSTMLSYVLEALSVWTKAGDSPALVVLLTDKRPYYKLAASNDTRRAWYYSEGKYIVEGLSTGTIRPAGNPFLQPVSSPSPRKESHVSETPYPGQEEEEPLKKSKRRPSNAP